MRNEGKKPDSRAGAFSRSRKPNGRRKSNVDNNLAMVDSTPKALTVVKKQETRIKKNYNDKKYKRAFLKGQVKKI